MVVDPSTITSWGSAGDTPQREAMRALLIGRAFMAAYREARGGEKKHNLSWWFDWVRKNTAPDLQWMWSNERAYADEHADVYAQVAGDLILEQTAGQKLFSDEWFRTDISDAYGWLFEPACLRHDGWKQVDLKNPAGENVQELGPPEWLRGRRVRARADRWRTKVEPRPWRATAPPRSRRRTTGGGRAGEVGARYRTGLTAQNHTGDRGEVSVRDGEGYARRRLRLGMIFALLAVPLWSYVCSR